MRVRGDFELFSPAGAGANLGWHRDGHAPGILLAHLLLEQPGQLGDGAAASAELSPKDCARAAAARQMDWMEVALPVPPAEAGEGDDAGEAAYEVAFAEDAAELGRAVSGANFVALPSSDGGLCIFEDARTLHRSPLTCLACPAAVGGLSACRDIVRAQFWLTSAEGAPVTLEECLAGGECQSEMPAWWPPVRPPELMTLCDALNEDDLSAYLTADPRVIKLLLDRRGALGGALESDD